MKCFTLNLFINFRLRFVYAYGDVKDTTSSDYEATFTYNNDKTSHQKCRIPAWVVEKASKILEDLQKKEKKKVEVEARFKDQVEAIKSVIGIAAF